MLTLSKAFRRMLFANKREYIASAEITLTNYRRLSFSNTRIWSGGFSVEDAVSEDDSFTAVGAAIMGAATLIINNIDEAYSSYDFTNAKVALYVGMQVEGATGTYTERVQKGTYIVDDATYNGATIALSLLDNMELFDRPYSTSYLRYPATLKQIVTDACNRCGVTLATTSFPHDDYVVQTRPSDKDSITYRDVIGWAAAIAGCFARCNAVGRLEIAWFNQDEFEHWSAGYDGGDFTKNYSRYTTGDTLDGGNFKPWDDSYDSGEFTSTETIEDLDGGTLTDYSPGVAMDGGLFNPWNGNLDGYNAGLFSDENPMHYITSLYSQNVSMDDTVITGVNVIVQVNDDSGTYTKTYSKGSAGYVIDVENNDFITVDTAQDIANWLGEKLIGLRFRKSSVTHADDPSIEAGDIGILYDKKGNAHPILITRTAFSIGAPQTTVCGADTPLRNSATKYSALTKTYTAARKALNTETVARQTAIQDLTSQIADSSGFYYTKSGSGNSIVMYMHDRPALSNSKVVFEMTKTRWRGTSNYRGSSTVWDIGMESGWDYLKGLIEANGLSGTWVKRGTIADAGNNTAFNVETGFFMMKKGSINIGDGTFRVDSDGKLIATDSTLKGTMYNGSEDGLHIELKDGGLKAGYGDTFSGLIAFSALFSGEYEGRGLKIESDGAVAVKTDQLWIRRSDIADGEFVQARTEKISYTDEDGNVSHLFFVNGLLCNTSW